MFDGILTYQTEPISAIKSDGEELFKLHWEEVANYRDVIPLDVQWTALLELEKQGKTVLITVRHDGKLIGYSGFTLNKHFHYKIITAYNDVIFVHPDYRKKAIGLQLIKQSESVLKKAGADKIKWHMKPEKSFGIVLKRMGYIQEEEIYGKLI